MTELNEEMINTLIRENNLKPIEEDPSLDPRPTIEEGYANFVVVNNIPVVGSDKYDRLIGLLKKLFSVCGTIVDIYMPYKEDNSTTNGFAIIEFSNETESKQAIEKYNNYSLDKSHTFKVVAFSTFESVAGVPDEFKEPEIKIPERPDTKTWLMDNRSIDQYLITCVDKIEVCWNTADKNKLWNDTNQKKPEVIYEMNKQKANSFDKYRHEWSPQGNFLVSIIHENGVMLSIVTSLSNSTRKDGVKAISKLPHPGVQRVIFSPNEKFITTVSDNGKIVKIWEVLSGTNVLVFKLNEGVWPPLQWSHDDKYLATMEEDKILIYDTNKMEILENKILKVPRVQKFSWAPTSNLLTYYIPEESGKPASVSVMEIPSRKILKAHSIYDVKNITFEWHPQGEFLGVKIDREVKAKKGKKVEVEDEDDQFKEKREPEIMSKYDFIKLKEKGMPVVQLDTKDTVLGFSFEKEGSRFALIHRPLASKKVTDSNSNLSVSSSPVNKKPNVSFYKIAQKGINNLVTLDNRPTKYIFWSNNDGVVALVGDKSQGYVIEFYNLNYKETMTTVNHPNAQVFSWDPTGRFFVSGVSLYDINTENGFFVWSFDGKLLQKIYKDSFLGVHWRPRPPSILTNEMEKKIKKEFDTYVQRYRDEDNLLQKNSRREFYESRMKTRKEFYNWRDEALKEYNNNLSQLKSLVSHYKEDSYQNCEVVVEEILSITETEE